MITLSQDTMPYLETHYDFNLEFIYYTYYTSPTITLNQRGTIMIKVYIELNTDNDIQRLVDAGYSLNQITPAIGSYKGQVSPSYMITMESMNLLPGIVELARLYKQESIRLELDGQAQLVFMDPEQETINLGAMSEITEKRAHELDAWTLVEGKYYAAS